MSKGDQPANTDFAAETAMIAAVLHHSIEAILLADDISLSPSDFFRSTNIVCSSTLSFHLKIGIARNGSLVQYKI